MSIIAIVLGKQYFPDIVSLILHFKKTLMMTLFKSKWHTYNSPSPSLVILDEADLIDQPQDLYSSQGPHDLCRRLLQAPSLLALTISWPSSGSLLFVNGLKLSLLFWTLDWKNVVVRKAATSDKRGGMNEDNGRDEVRSVSQGNLNPYKEMPQHKREMYKRN